MRIKRSKLNYGMFNGNGIMYKALTTVLMVFSMPSHRGVSRISESFE